MSGTEVRVRVESLRRRYGDLVAVDDVSFEVRRGEAFGLIGPDGAGKTTALRVVLGLLEPHGGRVESLGLDPLRHRRRLSRRVGYLPQRFSLYGDLSADENIAFFASIHGVRDWRARREDLLEMLRLAPFRRRRADRLSGGMRQKLALACTLVHTPELLVLDEPTSGVDPVSRREVWRLIASLQRQGLTILLTTPYLDEAERCGRVGLMHRGRLLTVDEPAALRASAEGVVLELLARPRRRAAELLLARSGVTDVQTFGERLHATLEALERRDAAGAASRLGKELEAAGIEVQVCRPVLPSLEDVFIARIRAADDTALREVPR